MDGQISNLTFHRKEFTDEWLEVFRHSFLETSQELPKIILILSLICMIGGRCNSVYFSVFCGCILYMSPYRIKEGEGNGTPLQYSCLENPMHRGAWWAAVYGVAMSRTRLSDFTSLFTFIGEGMATRSSVLAWRIPGMGEPHGLPSIRSHRVGHN